MAISCYFASGSSPLSSTKIVYFNPPFRFTPHASSPPKHSTFLGNVPGTMYQDFCLRLGCTSPRKDKCTSVGVVGARARSGERTAPTGPTVVPKHANVLPGAGVRRHRPWPSPGGAVMSLPGARRAWGAQFVRLRAESVLGLGDMLDLRL